MTKIATSILAAGGFAMCATAELNIIPAPLKAIEGNGVFETTNMSAASVSRDQSIPAEGYRLSVSADGIKIVSSDDAGVFYARQTLAQIAQNKGGGKFAIPYVEIEDAPRFKWRGLLFDDCRHFFGKEAMMKTLNAMAYHKLNVLHWVITQDQAWRIEIKKYPRLTEVGSVRSGSPRPEALLKPGRDPWESNGIQYGPYFYTQEDIREIVQYAAERYITIVPEIELPGHAVAALAAYPELGCTGEQFEPWTRWGVSEHIFCGGNDKTIKFLEDVLDEVCRLFPGPVVHIGGDEAPKTMWKNCPKCQARIKELGLDGEEGLQGWMTRHFTEYLAAKGKRAIGWDEILDGNPGNDTIIMSWRGAGGGIKAAARGNDAIMTPVNPCYIDNPQGLEDDPYQYINYGFQCTLELCYGFDPVAGIPENEQHHILGGQGNNWSEYTFNPSEYEWKMWPRMSALAECLWSAPERKNWESFQRRVAVMRKTLIHRFRMNCAPLK